MVRPHGDRGDIARWFSPMKLFEYMALGRAIVCSRLSVLEEVLTDGRNALLCTADAEQDWLAALRRLDADRRLVADLGAQARREFTGRYTWQARAQRFLDGVL
jgi:glycosyltransferase involved in cell wall biosynthesis